MEIDKRRIIEHSPLTPQVAYAMKRIDKRVERVLASAGLTPEQRQEILALGNLSRLALSLGNPVAIGFTKELIELTDPMMSHEEPPIPKNNL